MERALLCFALLWSALVNRPQQIGYRKDKAQATPGPGTYEPKIDIETFKGAPTSRYVGPFDNSSDSSTAVRAAASIACASDRTAIAALDCSGLSSS